MNRDRPGGRLSTGAQIKGSGETLPSRALEDSFALLMPHSSAADTQLLCNRLRTLFEEKCNAAEGMQVKLTIGIADYVRETDESGADLLAKATAGLQIAEES